MRGFKKSEIQVKGAEKFFERENKRQERARRRAARRGTGRGRRVAVVVFVLLVVVALGLFIEMQQTQIIRLRAMRDAEISALRSRVSTLSAKLEDSDRQVVTLKENVAELEKQVEVEQSQRVRAEAELRSMAKRKL